MRSRKRRGIFWMNFCKYVFYTGIFTLLAVSCSSNTYEGKIVAVEVEELSGGLYKGAKLISFDPDKKSQSTRELSSDFESACAPALSHDARYLYFQAKKSAADPWQIWVMDLQKNSTRKVTDVPEDCFHPASLPDGSVVFSRGESVEGTPINSLFRCNMDGTELTRITFQPGENLFPSVLWEGRLLYLRRQPDPEFRQSKLMIMRPDGTKSELYYKGTEGQYPVTGGIESPDGYVYFIEQDGHLSRVQHSRPLFSREKLSQKVNGRFSAVFPYLDSRLLVSYRPEATGTYGLYEFDMAGNEDPSLLYQGENHITQPLWIIAQEKRPRILPSAVNQDKSTALLMSQNINHSMNPVHSNLSGDSVADRIRVYGLEGLLGEVNVETDGSFYLVLDADIPVQIETINRQGETVRGPSDWIYLRPNERRGCIGCHADYELAPVNSQPMAVKDPPVDLSTRKELTNK